MSLFPLRKDLPLFLTHSVCNPKDTSTLPTTSPNSFHSQEHSILLTTVSWGRNCYDSILLVRKRTLRQIKGSGRGRTRIFSSDHTCRTPLSNSDLCTLLSLPFYLLPREFCSPSLLLLSSPTVHIQIASEKRCLHSTLILAPALKLPIRAEILRLSLTVALELLYRGNYLFITN